jgi:hypothetical protein
VAPIALGGREDSAAPRSRPGQRDVRCIKPSSVKDAPRPIRRKTENNFETREIGRSGPLCFILGDRSAVGDVQQARRHLLLRPRRHALPRLQSVQPRPPLQTPVSEEHGLALIGAGSEVPSQFLEQIAEVSAEPPEYSLLRSPDLGPRSSAAENSKMVRCHLYLGEEQLAPSVGPMVSKLNFCRHSPSLVPR